MSNLSDSDDGEAIPEMLKLEGHSEDEDDDEPWMLQKQEESKEPRFTDVKGSSQVAFSVKNTGTNKQVVRDFRNEERENAYSEDDPPQVEEKKDDL